MGYTGVALVAGFVFQTCPMEDLRGTLGDRTDGDLNFNQGTGSMTVTGDANLDASSDIALVLQGYTPVLDDTWDIVDAATISSDYGSIADLFDITSADPGAGLSWDFSSFTTDGSVKVVPEPATLALLGLGAAASFVLRRRHRA